MDCITYAEALYFKNKGYKELKELLFSKVEVKPTDFSIKSV